jgi:protein-S-isoprenylcysteine O-methyltransferase Ste14
MDKIVLFIIFSSLLILYSWRSLFNFRNHGIYRFVSWECLLWLALSNYKYWFEEPLSIHQIASWLSLIYAAYLVTIGFILLKFKGKADGSRQDATLFRFERTTLLVESGIYKFIRHPLYGSILFLTWGVFFKNPDFILLAISVISSVFIIATVKTEEKENILYFGAKYLEYMNRTKMFVPFII